MVGLVGKGITFDTGGISIKPSENMHEMKTDMAGGATMLGVMQVVAQLKPRVRVIALVPATENMPSGKAYKPGDVITSMSGKTIEILNTDAEGRLVLGDALTYAKQLGCTVLIDAATLTGAVAIALGNLTTGVFGWNQDWVNRVLAAARRGRGKNVATPRGRRLSRALQEHDRRPREHGRTLRWSDYRRYVCRGIRRRHALGPSRHRGHALVQ